MKPNGGGDKIPGNLEENRLRSRLGRQDERDFLRPVTQFGSAGAGLRSRTARSRSPRHPTARTRWCTAASRSPRAWEHSYYRLSPAPRLSQSLHGSSGQLGICGRMFDAAMK
jgi:hypothetical protein